MHLSALRGGSGSDKPTDALPIRWSKE